MRVMMREHMQSFNIKRWAPQINGTEKGHNQRNPGLWELPLEEEQCTATIYHSQYSHEHVDDDESSAQ